MPCHRSPSRTVLPSSTLAGVLALLIAATCGLTAAASPAGADGRAVALGDRGELYRAVAGTYGDLFPQAAALAPDTPVLALDVSEPGAKRVRRLVPGSEGAGIDGYPALVFEGDSGTAFVVWESRADPAASSVLLAGLRGEEWSAPFELSGDVDPLKGPPLVLITRDHYGVPERTDGMVLRNRSVLHAVWWELAADGTESIQYTPVILEAGAYVGWNPVYRLNELDPHAPLAAPGAAAGPYSSPSLSAGKDLHTVMVAFANQDTSHLLTVEARVLPGELGLIAERLRDTVIEVGYDEGEDRIRSIRAELRAVIIEIGNRFHPGVTKHFADSVVEAAQDLHDARPGLDIRTFAGDLRAVIIEIGVRALGDVDRQLEAKVSRVLEIAAPNGPTETADESVPSVVRLQLVHDLPAPAEPTVPGGANGTGEPGADRPARIFASEDGTRLLVAWDREGEVVYTESLSRPASSAGTAGEAELWTAPLTLELGEDEGRLTVDEVEIILRSRVQRRPQP